MTCLVVVPRAAGDAFAPAPAFVLPALLAPPLALAPPAALVPRVLLAPPLALAPPAAPVPRVLVAPPLALAPPAVPVPRVLVAPPLALAPPAVPVPRVLVVPRVLAPPAVLAPRVVLGPVFGRPAVEGPRWALLGAPCLGALCGARAAGAGAWAAGALCCAGAAAAFFWAKAKAGIIKKSSTAGNFPPRFLFLILKSWHLLAKQRLASIQRFCRGEWKVGCIVHPSGLLVTPLFPARACYRNLSSLSRSPEATLIRSSLTMRVARIASDSGTETISMPRRATMVPKSPLWTRSMAPMP